MSRSEVNRSGEMEVFVRVVDDGGFSAAARALRITPSAVSKLVSRLEARLGARLVSRSTRKLMLTPEGTVFYERAVRVLDDIAEAEREASSGAQPRGRVRVNCNVGFGMTYLPALVPGFMAAHPEVELELIYSDRVVDLLEERADVAIRVGPLRSSRLVARKLGESRMAVVASPDYLARRGRPQTPDDLAHHQLIGFSFMRSAKHWVFKDADGEVRRLPDPTTLQASDGEAAKRLAMAGAGIARLGAFHCAAQVRAGVLVSLLEDHDPGDMEEIHAVYVGQGGRLPARVRAFIDYLAQTVRIDDFRVEAEASAPQQR